MFELSAPLNRRCIEMDDIRAALTGMALAAHGSGDGEVARVLAASASRLVGNQTADLEGFDYLVEKVAELHMVRSGFIPDELLAAHSSMTAIEIATGEAEDDVRLALERFGA